MKAFLGDALFVALFMVVGFMLGRASGSTEITLDCPHRHADACAPKGWESVEATIPPVEWSPVKSPGGVR